MSGKVIRLLVILTEIYLVGLIISGTIQRGLPTNPIFWTASVVEIALGSLTYSAYKRYLADKSYRRWHFLLLVLNVIGIGAPITLFYTVDFLKPAGGTWGIYVLTVNSFYLYRIIKREPIQRQDIPSGHLITPSKVLQSVFLATVVAMLPIVGLLPTFHYVPVFSNKDPDLLLIEAVLAVMSLLVLAIGMYLPRIVGRIWKTNKSDMFVYFVHILRLSLFESVAIFGLILGILGGAWYTWLPLLLLTGAAMVFTFPTTKRWEEWKTGRAPIQ